MGMQEFIISVVPSLCCKLILSLRFLNYFVVQVTTLGRYGMNTSSQCRIPVGAFYGHTFLLPWQLQPTHTQSPIPIVNKVSLEILKGEKERTILLQHTGLRKLRGTFIENSSLPLLEWQE